MKISEYLHSCRKLVRFCSQNGLIDNKTLRHSILELEDGAVIVMIEFEEIVMEGSGCIAARVSCYGQMRIYLDNEGEVLGSELL
jgi:hypothetical protein